MATPGPLGNKKRIARDNRSMRRRIVLGSSVASAVVLLLSLIGWTLERPVGAVLMLLSTLLAVGTMLLASLKISAALRRRLSTELELAEDKHFIQTIFDATPDLIYVYDLAQRRYVYLNRSLPDILGYSPEAAIAMGDSLISELVHPEDLSKLGTAQERLLRAGEGRREDTEFRLKHVRGEYRWLRSREVVFKRDKQGDPIQILGMATDITARKQAESQLAEANKKLEGLATTDALTGLANRRLLFDRLDLEIARSARSGDPVSVVLLDVDFFKPFNDEFGHPAGDEVLRRVGCLLQAGIRGTDLAARHGGEEFAIVLPGSDAEEAVRTAERLRTTIESEPWQLRPITASFGVATLRDDLSSPELVALADRALYASKTAGRNRVTLL